MTPLTRSSGLSSEEAAKRLREHGPNELSTASRPGVFSVLWEAIREPMVLLLFVCGFVYLIFGDLREAGILLASVFLVIGITLFQERKTGRALDALRNLSSPRANVIRDGTTVRIASRDVVPGDELVLEEGDRVPADALLLSLSELRVDESLLTGESLAVTKKPSSYIYASTLIVRGRAHARVEATGRHTEVGKIGRALETTTSTEGPLNKEIRQLVKMLAAVAGALCLLTVIGLGVLRREWREGLLAGLTLAMSLLPEEFPVVLTIFFALGAFRMAKERILTRRLPAIETLGAATVLCTDKTGTITENRMTVTHYATTLDDGFFSTDQPIDPRGQALAACAALACPPQSFDAVDQAAMAFGEKAPNHLTALRKELPIREYPLTAQRPMLAEVRAWEGQLFFALKGAPEAVAQLCRWESEKKTALSDQLKKMAVNGLRLIAVAKAVTPNGPPPENLEGLPFEFAGILGMTDPLRAGVKKAVEECRSAGVQVMILTGDFPQTAMGIARQAGIRETSLITGAELETMSDDILQSRLPDTDLFARVTPSHKLRLVEILRRSGATVAMTGDGVNDAPALKAAHIGIAMGGRGTDVAREAADLVVLDDNFVSIVGAIRMGRRIYLNLQKSIGYLVAVHVPIAGMALLPIVMGWPLFFSPIHIVFLELIIDPACSLVFESEQEEDQTMKQPPRLPGSRLLNRERLIKCLIDGLLVWGVTAAVYRIASDSHAAAETAKTVGFITLVLGNLLLILTHRTRTKSFWTALRTPNRAWIIVSIITLAALGLTLAVPFLRELFGFAILQRRELHLCLLAMASLTGVFYLVHAFENRINRGDHS